MKKLEIDEKTRGRVKKTKENLKSSKIHSNIGSPYSKPNSKPRSNSNSKSNLNLNYKPSTTSNLGSTKNIFQETMPLSAKHKQLLKHAYSEIKFESFHEDEIEKRLSNDLKNAKNSENEFEIYQKYFGEIIKLDKKFEKVLLKIKSGYDSKISNSESNALSRLKTEIKDLQNIVSKEIKEKKIFTRKLEKLSKENVQLSRSLDETEEKYNSLVFKLKDISNFDIGRFPKDEITWKSLILENQTLNKINKDLQNEIRILVGKEKKLVDLLKELKIQGYPIEKVYEKHLANNSDKESSRIFEDESESDGIVSGRPKTVKKPAIIPKLNLDEIKPEFSSDDSLLSEIS